MTTRRVFHGTLGALHAGHGIVMFPNATGVVIEQSDAWEIELRDSRSITLPKFEYPRVGDVEPIEGTYMRAGGYRFTTPTDPYEQFIASLDDDSSLAAGGRDKSSAASATKGGVA